MKSAFKTFVKGTARRSISGAKTPEVDRSEGDVNLSAHRNEFMASHIGDEAKEVLAEDAKYFLHQTLSTPCMNVLKGCQGVNIIDTEGREIMDFHGNSVHQVGHANPDVVAALKKQLDEMPFCPRRYTNPKAVELAKKIVSLAADHGKAHSDGSDEEQLTRVLYTPGGTSSIGIALKLARITTGRFKTISMWESFHGASLDAISIGGESVFRKNIGPLMPGTSHAPPPNEQECVFNCNGNCNLSCAKYVEYILEKEQDVAAVIAEPIRWTPYIPKDEYWKIIRKACDKYGALLIFDEIPNSLGRTGNGMFTYQNFSVQPDIVVLGKGLGGGIVPMSAILAKEKLNEAAKIHAMGHYTHEKTPMGATAALATIKYIEDNNLVANAKEMGEYFLSKLRALKEDFPIIHNVRAAGLLIGIELRTPEGLKATDESERVLYSCLKRGLSYKITTGNVLTWCPPLIITKDQADKAVSILRESLEEL
eukprot:TRINITY_DN16718_c0_g1_i1.p1 TRINITY_DN16718_c0_g1~~TRINITY_DN16718_c0_g1_i1.p1  ORF type:complete len:492 (+),score=92.30 TRINITY_DN16718_c0_g1_i1:39-1478(+)